MNKIVHYIGLDVHKETIAVSIAPQNATEVRRYGIIGGTLDAVDKQDTTGALAEAKVSRSELSHNSPQARAPQCPLEHRPL